LSANKSRARDLRRVRRSRSHGCWDHLIVAALWVAYKANLGTLLRTCDAVGACTAVPDTEHYREALAIGDTLRLSRRPCIRWLRMSSTGGSSANGPPVGAFSRSSWPRM
jgi:tRNA (guanosine-2'-O-)-methyltransferase